MQSLQNNSQLNNNLNRYYDENKVDTDRNYERSNVVNTNDEKNIQDPDILEERKINMFKIIDNVPLSRPKKSIARDFSDGVLIAEIIKFFCPNIVELHNYPSSNNTKGKLENWKTLNRKVLKKLNICLDKQDIESIVNFVPQYIESVLMKLFDSLEVNGIDIEKTINKYNQCYNYAEDILDNNIKEDLSSNKKFINNNKIYDKFKQVEDEYKKELIEKDEIIEELKEALLETEKNLKISEDNKKILNNQYDNLKRKLKDISGY